MKQTSNFVCTAVIKRSYFEKQTLKIIAGLSANRIETNMNDMYLKSDQSLIVRTHETSRMFTIMRSSVVPIQIVRHALFVYKPTRARLPYTRGAHGSYRSDRPITNTAHAFRRGRMILFFFVFFFIFLSFRNPIMRRAPNIIPRVY